MALTIKQEKFCLEYLKTGCASQAYRNAYTIVRMTPKSVNEKASQMLKQVKIASRVNELKVRRSERTEIDADYVLKRLVEIDQMDVLDILDNAGNMLPINQWPKSWRTTLSGLDIQELIQGDTLTVIKKIKWPDKVKNIELLGKHVTVQAFSEKKEIVGDLTINNLIAEISASNGESRKVLPSMQKK